MKNSKYTSDRKDKVVFHSLTYTFANHLAINDTLIFRIQNKMNLRYAKLSLDTVKNHIKKHFYYFYL